VNPSVPVKTVPDLIAYAKVNSGKINMASGGIGSGNDIFGELVQNDDRRQPRARAVSRRGPRA
jgi:tripartite-type tricarboxylate transporter receptor subunit TctC